MQIEFTAVVGDPPGVDELEDDLRPLLRAALLPLVLLPTGGYL
jgi:hypothetical protein